MKVITLLKKNDPGQFGELDLLLDNFWVICDAAHYIVTNVVKSIKEIDNVSQELVEGLDKSLLDGTFDIGWIASASMKSRLLVMQIRLLTLIDWTTINIGEDAVEKYKKFAFQLAQTMCLLKGLEVYDKVHLIEKYTTMAPFIKRCDLSKDDLDNLTVLANEYAGLILQLMANGDHGLDVLTGELTIKKDVMDDIMENLKKFM